MNRRHLQTLASVCSWLPGCLEARWRRPSWPPKRVWLMIADHFEPFWRGADEATARRRVELWCQRWPEIAARHRDSAGRPFGYTFFYPEEEYRPELLDPLAEMAQTGIADVEVHIHHDGEGEQNFVDRMSRFTDTLFHRHGLLRKQNGKIAFGFIHGNWALDNSLPDGRWCGLNNEITLLKQLGCYADFTFPSAPSPTQPRMVNTIYWAKDDPERPKSYDTGVPVTAGGPVAGDLLMIPGPLGLRWRGQGRLLPRLETGELAAHNRLTPKRIRLWLELAPRIGEEVFVKLYTHGAQEANSAVLLDGDLDRLFENLSVGCAEGGIELRFASAWEMRQAVETFVCIGSAWTPATGPPEC
jgi:hypothetical protein